MKEQMCKEHMLCRFLLWPLYLFILVFFFGFCLFLYFSFFFFLSPILDAFLLSRSTKILSPEIEEKNKEKKVSYLCGWKNQCVKCTWFVIFFFGLFISFLVFFFVFLSFSVLLIFFLIYFGCFDLCSFLKKLKCPYTIVLIEKNVLPLFYLMWI